MASNIVLKTYAAGDNNQGSVTPQNDALIYQCAVPMNGLFSGGTVTLSSANVLHVAAGFGIIGGRFFEILESDIAVQLSTSGTLLGRLYVHLSLTNADEPISLETATGATLPALSGDPTLNITNGDFDMELCTFNINELTISDIVQTFPSITAANNQIRRATAYSINDVAMCQSASDALIFICTTAGTTAVTEPVGYATVTDGNTVADGTAVFKAISIAGYMSDTQARIQLTESNIAKIIIGDKCIYSGGASIGQFVIVRNSTISGVDDGLYLALKAIPYNTSIDSTYLSVINAGGLNTLKNAMLLYKEVEFQWDSSSAVGVPKNISFDIGVSADKVYGVTVLTNSTNAYACIRNLQNSVLYIVIINTAAIGTNPMTGKARIIYSP